MFPVFEELKTFILGNIHDRQVGGRLVRVKECTCSTTLATDQAAQFTSPLQAVASTTMPKAMRYQAKGTKSCVLM